LTRNLESQIGSDIHVSVHCFVELLNGEQMPFMLALSPHIHSPSPANPSVFVPAAAVASLPLIVGVSLSDVTTQMSTTVHCSSH